MRFTKESIAEILELFGMVEAPKPGLVSILQESNPMPHNSLVLCTYGRHRYMILSDDSATHQPDYVKRIFEDALLIPSSGHLVENPVPQPDGERYAVSYQDSEYYLWSYDKDE